MFESFFESIEFLKNSNPSQVLYCSNPGGSNSSSNTIGILTSAIPCMASILLTTLRAVLNYRQIQSVIDSGVFDLNRTPVVAIREFFNEAVNYESSQNAGKDLLVEGGFLFELGE